MHMDTHSCWKKTCSPHKVLNKVQTVFQPSVALNLQGCISFTDWTARTLTAALSISGQRAVFTESTVDEGWGQLQRNPYDPSLGVQSK